MSIDLRKTDIEIIGDVPWGTHFCQFYQTKEDLLDILVPYFKKGLQENEFCMWVTAAPLSVEEAKRAMRRTVPHFERYLKKGQIEIIPYSKWYIRGGCFEERRVLNGWVRKLNKALKNGFEGLRLTENTFWIEKKDWKAFADYEKTVNDVIGNYRMLAICTYSLGKCGVNEILDVVNTHQFTLIKREGAWRVIESSELKESKQALRVEIEKRKRMEEAYKRTEEVLRKSEAKFKALYDANIIGVVIGDLENNIFDANDAFLNIIGYTREELRKRKLNCNELTLKIYKERDKEAIAELIARGVTTPYEKEYVRKDGTHVLVILGKVLINKDAGETIAFVLDITERKKLEERKDEFIGTASHELKTPITIIKAFTEIMLKRFEKSKDTQNEYFARNINEQVDRLTNLVNDLLDVSKIQAGKLKFNSKMFDIDKLITKTVVDFQYITKTHQIERNGEVGKKLYGDEGRIHQALVNLISNAVKYSPNANRVIVRTAERKGQIVVSVQDFGLGISDSNKEKIFERFYTGREKEKRNIPGFGMGLYICKEIIKGHKGELWVESKRGEGSTFFFTLPMSSNIKKSSIGK